MIPARLHTDLRAQLATIVDDPHLELVAAQLAAATTDQRAQIWAQDMPADWTGDHPLVALAERVIAPMRRAYSALRSCGGDFDDARRQLLQDVALPRASAVAREAVGCLDRIKAEADASTLARLRLMGG
jgi:hypothetical protein